MAKATPANRDVRNNPPVVREAAAIDRTKNTLKGRMEAARPARRAAGCRAFNRHLIGTGGMA